ncbi:endospore germination permease [Bacillus sp. DNRA2]|uniref:endospore germination permease n=1 Tax=Bacillus sp. DNRA2 TaxID=2723053 RepID=UPI00145C61E3|nr:endospore germination permease [Bacillus sp. DNRA2]
MIEQGKISNLQLSVIIIAYTIGTSIITVPTITSTFSKQDGWLSSILSLGCGVLLVLLYGYMSERYPQITLTQLSEQILGKWIGGAVSILFFIFYLFITSIFVRISGDLITTHILPETPIQAIEILFLFVIIMAVRLGLEPIARTTEMLFPHIFMLILFAILFLLPHIKIVNLTPFLEFGMKPVLHGTFDILGAPYLNLFVILMITPFINKPKRVKLNFVLSTIIGGIIIIIITTLSIAVLSAPVTSRLNYSPYMLAQKIDIGNFIQRIEIVAGAFIFITLYLKAVISFYAMVLSIAQTFRLKNYKILTLPLGMIVQVLSTLQFSNIIDFHYFVRSYWTLISAVMGLFFPLMLLSVDIAKSKLRKNKQNEVSKPL